MYYALIPAAGGGTRMAAALPKQYLPLAGQPLLCHALDALCATPAIAKVFLVLAPDDGHWRDRYTAAWPGRVRVLRCGGATRAESVANGLDAAAGEIAADDWVLVHDAARACLTRHHIETLIAALADDPVGGLLAVPVADTLKRGPAGNDEPRVAATVPRDGLWQAQTPQMFRRGLLQRALQRAPAVTDEAGAVEALGLRPRLVPGDMTNLKVTYPIDLQLAEWILRQRRELP